MTVITMPEFDGCPSCGQPDGCRWQCVCCLSTLDGCPWESPMVCDHCVDAFRQALAEALLGWLP